MLTWVLIGRPASLALATGLVWRNKKSADPVEQAAEDREQMAYLHDWKAKQNAKIVCDIFDGRRV